MTDYEVTFYPHGIANFLWALLFNMKNIICLIFGHKKPHTGDKVEIYKSKYCRKDTYVVCKRCGQRFYVGSDWE